MTRVQRAGGIPLGLLCILIKNGYSVRGVRRGLKRRPLSAKPAEPNNAPYFLYWLARMDRVALLLIVLEHGSPYSLASAEDSCQPSAVSHLRITSLLDCCCKSQGYFLKSSCFERQTPLEVDFRAFWFPSGGILRHQSILAWAP